MIKAVSKSAMDGKVHCPNCEVDWPAQSGLCVCPSCAGPLFPGASEAQAYAAVERELICDLRDAFGLSPEEKAVSPFASPVTSRTSLASDGLEIAGPITGQRFGDYEVLGEIARGGMGIVYRARQLTLGRDVALKVLPGAGLRVGASIRRFRTEARAVARLHHPNIVPVFDHGEYQTHVYYAMALIDGCNLDVAIHRRPELLSSTALRSGSWDLLPKSWSPSSNDSSAELELNDNSLTNGQPPLRTVDDYQHLARLFADVADGLAHAHSHGVIHRDIKPQNLLLSREGRLFITDFGVAALTDEPHFTITGEVMGTPAYLSPEQARGEARDLDHRTDVYSLGVTLYELLTGRRPFRGKNRDEILGAIRTEDPVRPRWIHRAIPRDLETICLRAIEKAPNKRYQNAAAIAEDLRRFATGQVILSPRPSRLERFVRVVRAHKIATTLLVSWLLTGIVTTGYVATRSVLRKAETQRVRQLSMQRSAEAQQLLQAAYDQLVYTDYQHPELVQDSITRAAGLNPDLVQLELVRSLAELGAGANVDAANRLDGILDQAPENRVALYLLAWARRRANDRPGAAQAFERAEAFGGPQAADEWFFRGLASTFDHPQLAIDSYIRANSLRAAQHQFFPQAILHLARANNQEMYANRTQGAFRDAESALLQFVQQQQYNAYPCYLLSITERLYGEILAADVNAADPNTPAHYFQLALDWARRGQEIDPTDARPVTAEAECLEVLGEFEGAIDARTRSISVATKQEKRCEGFHYRWRLHYWMGHVDDAMNDVRTHAVCMPESIHYAHSYPAWLYAEQGDLPRALDEARSIAQSNPTDAQAVLWSASCLRFLGQADEAQQLLEDRSSSVNFSQGLIAPQSEEWLRALYACATGQRDLSELLTMADANNEPRKLRAEVLFHLAIKELSVGERNEAMRLLNEAYRCFDSELRYTYHAKALLVKLENDPEWPGWLLNQ